MSSNNIKVGDKVRAAIYPAPVIGTVLKVVGRAVFIDAIDDAGRELCVAAEVCTKIPGLSDIGFVERLH